ncbi:MAG: hypothetical protein A2104_00095 [Candidatus Melainabacteria bacterium GWF2_32_7]|nr:MAG: hypothetical protein A2104_00095 [Candidatus Melainabacteria bacterium GWF2_32_7]
MYTREQLEKRIAGERTQFEVCRKNYGQFKREALMNERQGNIEEADRLQAKALQNLSQCRLIEGKISAFEEILEGE